MDRRVPDSIPGQGHVPGFQVRSLPLFGVHVGGSWSVQLSHIDLSLSPFLPSSLPFSEKEWKKVSSGED